MKNTLTLSLLLLPWLSFSQLVENLPTNSEGKLCYSEVIQVDSTSKEELYLRSKLFFGELFGGSKEAIKFEDRETGTIIGEGAMEIAFIYLGLIYNRLMYFTVTVETKENRYRYQIAKLYYTDKGSTTPFFAEDYFKPENYYKGSGKPKPQNESTLVGTKNNIAYIEHKLKTIMQRPIQSEEW